MQPIWGIYDGGYIRGGYTRDFTVPHHGGAPLPPSPPQGLPSYLSLEGVLQVLKHLGYVDQNNLVELKGKVACEISQHEILVTELMLENIFR